MNGRQRLLSLPNYISIALLFALGILARMDLSFVSVDMQEYGLPWYDHLRSEGILRALGGDFSNYTPPYTYVLALMTLTSGFLPRLTAIKLVSVFADAVNAFLVFRIVRLMYPVGLRPLWAAGTFACLPTIFINSSIWGQADAIYMAFLLACVYCLLVDKPFWGMLAFSVSFAFKAQAVLLAPFVAVMLFKKRIHLWHLLLVPAVYATSCLPVVLLGRTWPDVLTIYFNQASSEQDLALGAPNPYVFLPWHYYDNLLWPGLIGGSLVIGAWIAWTVLRGKNWTQGALVFIALVSVVLAPFVLPKMHDRYFYPADVLSLVSAFVFPALWFVPLVMQISSLSGYSVFLLERPITDAYVGAAINTLVLAFLLWKQARMSALPPKQADRIPSHPPAPTS